MPQTPPATAVVPVPQTNVQPLENNSEATYAAPSSNEATVTTPTAPTETSAVAVSSTAGSTTAASAGGVLIVVAIVAVAAFARLKYKKSSEHPRIG